MEPTPASAFLAAAEKTIPLSSGRNVTIRKLGMDELLDVPEAWPIFNVLMGQMEGGKKVSPQDAIKSALRNAEVQAAVITRGVISPKVTDDGADGSVPLHVFDHADRLQLVNEITLFSTGYERLIEMGDAAQKGSEFPEAPEPETDIEGG